MTEEQSIELFRHLNEALLLTEDPGCIALLEAVKFREARMQAGLQEPAVDKSGMECGCYDPAVCEDRDELCPPTNGSITKS